MNWLMVIMAAIFVIALLIMFEIYRESKSFVTKIYDVESDVFQWEESHTVVFVSDLHNHKYGKKNEQLLKVIKEQQPEFILVGGDIPVAKPGYELNTAIDFIENLAKEYKVYYSNGNHEHRMRLYPETYGDMHDVYTNAIKKAGVDYLINETRSIFIEDVKVDIVGLEIEREFYKRLFHKELQKEDIIGLVGEKNKKAYTILLAHNPEYFKAYARWGADLTLSGHVHGGVMRLPLVGGVISPSLKVFPKYDGGRKREFGKEMIISRGLGVHTIPIRLFNPAELVVLRLKPWKR
ncbi:MAG: metallophosphoesterase [Lachnospiraceae bacterium]|nr:metallophosphoesterase [Lachnospiraceae bacterium]